MPKWTAHQQAVIDHKNNNLLVSAAAGSGKTAVMIEHIFKTVTETNTSIDKMLVATYTNAAAASMKEKLNQKFDDALSQNPFNEKLLRQKQLLERANISTIHAFCIKTLRKYYFRTPLPPDFRIFETSQIKALSNAAISEVMEEAAKQYNNGLFPQYKDVLIQFAKAKNDKAVEELITDLERALEPLLKPEDFKNRVLELYKDNEGTEYKKFLKEYSDLLLSAAISHAEKLSEEYNGTAIESDVIRLMDGYITFFTEALETEDLTIKNQLLSRTIPSIRMKASPLKDVLKNNCVVIRKIRDTVKNLTANKEDWNLTFLLPAIEGLFILHERYVARFEEFMLKEGGTSFTGVLRYMTRLLEENEDIREDLKNSIDYIYIDEYQDTNAFQEYIISSLSKGNNMFFVGDIKQSIYGFQSARPELFKNKMDDYQSGIKGDRINLMNNFRSYPEILSGVNFIFKNLMVNEKVSEITYNTDAYLYPSPDVTSNQYSDCLYFDGNKQISNELLITEGNSEQEAYIIALKIKELLNTTIIDNGVMRPVQYRDIAILGRNTNIGNRFVPIFNLMGIPYSKQEKEQSDDSDTTLTVMALLRLLTLRRNDVDLITVLMSPMGGFTPTEVGKIRVENKKCSFYEALKSYNKSEKIKKKIDDFFNLLDDLELIEKSMGLADFIEYLTNETGYIYHTAYLPKTSKEQEALNNLISSARSYSEFSDKGLLGFLDYYQNVTEPQGSGFTLDENDNNVHFMTIHRSKGLEFPIVIVAGCSDLSKPSSKAYLFDEKFGFSFKYNTTDEFNVRTEHSSQVTDVIKVSQNLLETAEDLRVFYVALTRAKNKLILSVNGTRKHITESCTPLSMGVIANYKTYSELILPLFLYHKDGEKLRQYVSADEFNFDKVIYEESDWNIEVFVTPEIPEENEVFEDAEKFNETLYLEMAKANFEWKYPYSSATTQRTKQSPSKKTLRTRIPLRKPKFDDKEYKGAQKGTVVHFFMEHVSFTSNESATTQAKNMLQAGILTEDEFNALPFEQLEAFMDSPFKKRMENSPLICRERSFCHIIPFSDTGDEALVQGIIDCYFFEGDHIILLDYKTDFINGNLDEHILHHTPQLKMYKSALEELYPGKTVYPYIHFFYVNETVEIK